MKHQRWPLIKVKPQMFSFAIDCNHPPTCQLFLQLTWRDALNDFCARTILWSECFIGALLCVILMITIVHLLKITSHHWSHACHTASSITKRSKICYWNILFFRNHMANALRLLLHIVCNGPVNRPEGSCVKSLTNLLSGSEGEAYYHHLQRSHFQWLFLSRVPLPIAGQLPPQEVRASRSTAKPRKSTISQGQSVEKVDSNLQPSTVGTKQRPSVSAMLDIWSCLDSNVLERNVLERNGRSNESFGTSSDSPPASRFERLRTSNHGY